MAPAGDEVLVTFSVGVDDVLSTRTISDGKSVNQLVYQAFNKDDEPVGDLEKITVSNWPATPSLTLVTGKEYTVVFWAQKGETYNVDDLRAVKIDYAGATNNDESRDAFYKAEPVTVTEGMSTIPVELKRPFAQVNVGVKELGSLEEVTQSQMIVGVGSIYSQIDLLTGDVTGENDAPVTFAYAAIPDEKLTAADQDEYIWLSMSYLLVKDATIDLEFFAKNADKTVLDRKFNNIPVKPNYRTNLLGSTATTDVKFEVEIDPSYGESEDVGDEPMGPTDVTVSDVTATIEDGTVTFSASFVGDKEEIKSAYFVCTPDGQVGTRAGEDGVVKVVAVVGEKTLSAEGTVEDLELAAGTKYVVTVEINGKTVEASGETETPSFEVPEEPVVEKGTTPDNPFTVAEAIAIAEETGETPTETGYYIKGTISSISEQFGTKYGNATFEMDADGKTFTAFQVYYLAANQKWVEGNDTVEIGDEVIVYGKIVNFKGNTPETAGNDDRGYLVKFISQVPTISNLKATVGDDGKSVTFTAAYTNRSGETISKAGFKYGLENTDTDKPVEEVPSGKSGEITATVTDLTPGKYFAKAYLNDIETSEVRFDIVDQNQTLSPGTVLWEDDFSNANDKNGSTKADSWTGSIDGFTGNYEVANLYPCQEYLKFGTSSAKGSIKTPSISIPGKAKLKVTVKLCSWTNDKTVVMVSCEHGTPSVASFTLTKESNVSTTAPSEWDECELVVEDATNGFTIEFAASTASKKRFFMDDLKIEVVE